MRRPLRDRPRRSPAPPRRAAPPRAWLTAALALGGLPLAVATVAAVPIAAGTAAAASDADTCIASRGPAAGGTLGETAVHVSTLAGQRIGATHRALAFSPDGTRIVWADLQRPNGTNEYSLVTSALDGSDRRKVYVYGSGESIFLSQEFVWSANGRFLAFLTTTGVQSSERLKVVDVATGQVTFTSPFRVSAGSFDLSPDGTKVAYSDASGTFENDLWIANLDGSGSPQQILDDPTSNTSLPPWNIPKDIEEIRWSPNGSMLTFSGRNGISASPEQTAAYSEVYVVDVDGTDLRQVAATTAGQNDAARRWPTWSPDSTRIAFSFSRTVNNGGQLVQQAGMALVTLASGVVTELPGADRLSSYPGNRMEWSPSGGTLVAAATKIPPTGGSLDDYVYGTYSIPTSGGPAVLLDEHETQGSIARAFVSLVPCAVVQAGLYQALVPARLLDTRAGYPTVDGQFAGIGVRAAGSVTELQVTGRGGVATDASAVVLNVAVTSAQAPGYVTVFPCGADRPTAANLNYDTGDTIPNLVVAKIGDGGKVCIYTYAAIDLIADVNGAFGPGPNYVSLNPARLLETRSGYSTVDGQANGIGIRPAGSVTELQVAGRGGVPLDATAVVLNVAVTGTGGPGYLTVYPCGSDRPTAANLNYDTGDTIPNLVVAKVGDGGRVCIYTYAPTHLIADVNGAFPRNTSYVPLVPARVLETRPGLPTVDGSYDGIGKANAGSVTKLPVVSRAGVPLDASAVVVNIAVTEAEGPGYLTVYPCSSPRPTAANLNYDTGDTIPNLVVSGIGTNGDVCIYTYARVHLVVDVNGAFPDYL